MPPMVNTGKTIQSQHLGLRHYIGCEQRTIEAQRFYQKFVENVNVNFYYLCYFAAVSVYFLIIETNLRIV